MISLKDIRFSFGGEFSLAVDELTFPEGSISVIIGPNGSGKSTLMCIMAGFNREFSGEIEICGKSTKGIRVSDIAKLVSYVGPRPEVLPDMKVYDVVATGRYPYTGGLGILNEESAEAVEQALELTGLSAKREQKVCSLSTGEVQRVMIARAIAQNTPVMLMDESISNLDPKYTFEIINILKKLKKNKTIVMILHDLHITLNFFDKLIGMKDGRCSFVLSDKSQINADVVSELFDVGFDMHFVEDKSFISFK